MEGDEWVKGKRWWGFLEGEGRSYLGVDRNKWKGKDECVVKLCCVRMLLRERKWF